MPYDTRMVNQRMAVIDFETTGISPGMGDRATEVGIALMEGGRIVDRFQSLMNAGITIPAFITQLTGITNAMVEAAPPAEQVMREAARFVGNLPMVAHNASFDRRYWVAELARAGIEAPQPFACTVLLSRRVFPEAPSHKLGSLVSRFGLLQTGAAHRALADAEMAAGLLTHIQDTLRSRHGVVDPDHGFLMGLQRINKAAVAKRLAGQSKTLTTALPP
jgi:DNA polymerase-3 subunit epsilon